MGSETPAHIVRMDTIDELCQKLPPKCTLTERGFVIMKSQLSAPSSARFPEGFTKPTGVLEMDIDLAVPP